MAYRDYDHLFKIVMLGDSGVGKSCLLLRFADDAFTESFISTIGVDFRFRTIELKSGDEAVGKMSKIKLQIWDTAGQERFRTITSAYYRGADALVIVYDMTHIESFEHVRDWIKETRKYVDEDLPVIIVGNKSDRSDVQVRTHQLQQLASEYNTLYIETSARNAINVQKAFFDLASLCLKRKLKTFVELKDNVDINAKPKKSRCC